MSDKKTPPAGDVKVRVIAEHGGHKINDVLTLSADEAQVAKDNGWGDPSPAAVAYAESLTNPATDAAPAADA